MAIPVPEAAAADIEVTLDPVADITADRAKPEQLVDVAGRVAGLTDTSRYSVSFRSNVETFASGGTPGPDGDFRGTLRLQVGTYWLESVLRNVDTGAETVSNRVAFEVKPDPRTATKTTLIVPSNPVAKVKSAYVVKVDPSSGSTGRVDLYEFDNVGVLYRIGVGYLSNGQTTIYAATMAGQRKVIAEFAGDARFSGSGAGANLFAPVASDATPSPAPAAVPGGGTDATVQASPSAPPAAAAPQGQLAFTGADPWPGAARAAGLLVAGVMLLVATRRRRRGV
ncbi:hypothetical protein ACWGJ9_08610 [Curtobacterium citreum]